MRVVDSLGPSIIQPLVAVEDAAYDDIRAMVETVEAKGLNL